MLLVGSKALKCYDDKYICPNVRRHWDTDLIATYEEYQQFEKTISGEKKIIPTNKGKNIAIISKEKGIFDFEIAWTDSTGAMLIDLVKEHGLGKIVDKTHNIYAVNPDVVFTLKKSHRFLKDSPHFLKTMLDFKYLRDEMNCKVPEVLSEFFIAREKSTYWYKHPKLNVSKDDFFKDDGIPYKFDHDTIHLSVMLNDKPAYEYFKEDLAEVNCSKEKFMACPEHIKLSAVLEEAYVLALERSQIPAPGVWTPKKSFEYALMKISSSITSGWFRNYCYENHFKAKELYNPEYVNKFWIDVDSGLVKPFQKKSM